MEVELKSLFEELLKRFDIQFDKQPIQSSKSIVLVIDDFGYRNDSVSDGFFNLPVAITCAVLPGHPQSSSVAKKAVQFLSKDGYEVELISTDTLKLNNINILINSLIKTLFILFKSKLILRLYGFSRFL